MRKYVCLSILFALFVIFSFTPKNNCLLSEKHISFSSKAFEQNTLRIKQRNPVVNEGNRIKLSVIDSNGNPINNGIIWQSGSPDVASIDPTSGEIIGVKSGFATITAIRDAESTSTFVTVSKIRKSTGAKIPGDTKTDNGGSVYISDPMQDIILKVENSLNAKVKTFAGKPKVAGNRNGMAKEALFAGPTAIGVDNSANGGLYIADTLNHCIRKIGFNQQVETILGKNAPGLSNFAADGQIDIEKVSLNSPRGVVADNGGNFFIADTDNHSIYYVDISKNRVNIVAGEPGQSGKQDGLERTARFKRPSAMALSSDGRLLTVADEDNNRIRLIELSRNSNGDLVGSVSTLSANSTQTLTNKPSDQEITEVEFDKPQSVGIDGLGNIYVVDNRNVQLIVRPLGKSPELFELAQPNVSFNRAVSLAVKGTETFVLDANTNDSEALKVISVGAPEILSIEPSVINIGQTTELIVRGKNFAPDTQIVFGAKPLAITSIKAEEIRLQLPVQNLPGLATLSVLTRGGVAQKEINAITKPANMLALGEITTVAGGSIFLGNGGDANLANLRFPVKTIVDSSGNLFISDQSTRTVRRVDKQTKIITTIAGGGDSTSDNVLATTALIRPSSIAIDKSGDLFIVDSLSVIKKVNMLTGVITRVAGSFGKGFRGDGGRAIDAGFSSISDIAFDAKGNLLVLEPTRLRFIDNSTSLGIVSTIAGTGRSEFGGDGGQAVNASFMFATSLAVDNKGSIFIADFLGNRIRRINKKGIIDTVAGNGLAPVSTNPFDRDGKKATNISFFSPSNIAVDLQGNLFVQDNGSFSGFIDVISRVNLKTQIINTQKIDGKESNGQIVRPLGSKLSTDGLGNLFFTSAEYNVFQLNTKSNVATKVAGNTKFNLFGDNNLAVFAALGAIADVVSDSSGNLYIADSINGRVRRIDSSTGVITSFIGKDGAPSMGNNGSAMLDDVTISPKALTANGNSLLIADFQQNTWFIRQVDLTRNVITTIAGKASNDFSDGKPALETSFNSISSLLVDNQGNIYLLDDNKLRFIDAKTSLVSTLATLNIPGVLPNNLLMDKDGNMLVSFFGSLDSASDIGGGVLRFDLQTKKFSLFAGGKGISFDGEKGLAVDASLGYVESITLDAVGNLFVGAYTPVITEIGVLKKNPRIWKVDRQTGIISTLIDSRDGVYSGDGGTIINSSLADCSKVLVDIKGNLLVANRDFLVQSLRLIKLGN